jgi:hypothetical protein
MTKELKINIRGLSDYQPQNLILVTILETWQESYSPIYFNRILILLDLSPFLYN